MSLTGKLQGEDKHEAREAKYAKRVALYSRSRRVYEVEWCVQNYMLEKAFWLWREWNRMKRLETRIQLWDCENNLGKDDNDLAEQGYWDQTKCTNAKDIQNV